MSLSCTVWRPVTAMLALVIAIAAATAGGTTAARANPVVVVDVDSGAVLYQDMATAPWFPASLTKLMTTYVALSKVAEGKMSLDTPMRVSARAASMAPSKMGFRPGTLVTLDNALKMLMVKSPNDVAVTIAEGISGSVEAFADEMNAYAAKIGLHESHFFNPNGLPDPRHVSSARDMAMIGRALLREFPEQHALFGIGALRFAGRIINNHNGLLGRYPGVDGMKTGYTCSAGYNVVASAQRGDRRLIVVILGAPSGRERSERAAALFEKYFSTAEPSGSDLAALPASDVVMAPDLRGQICGPGRREAIEEAENEDAAILPLAPAAPVLGQPIERATVLSTAANLVQPAPVQVELLHPRDPFDPVPVYIGAAPGWRGSIAGPVRSPVEASAPGPGPAAAPADPQDGHPLALVGAVALSPALAAANRAVKPRGRLSLRVIHRVEPHQALPRKAAPRQAVPHQAAAKPVKARLATHAAATKAAPVQAAKAKPRKGGLAAK